MVCSKGVVANKPVTAPDLCPASDSLDQMLQRTVCSGVLDCAEIPKTHCAEIVQHKHVPKMA
jgi:hypothetical protein